MANKTLFVASALTAIALAFVVLTTVSGRWIRSENPGLKGWNEGGLFSYCTCKDIQKDNCKSENNYFRANIAFGLLAAITSFFALLALVAAVQLGNKALYMPVAGLMGVTALWNLIFFAIVAGQYRKEWPQECGYSALGNKSYYDLGYNLGWAWAFQVVEFILAIIAAVSAAKGAENKNVLVLLVALVTAMAVASITGRGLIVVARSATTNKYSEVGAFDTCTCYDWVDSSCRDYRSKFGTAAGIAICGILLEIALLVGQSFGSAHKVGCLVVGALGVVCNLVPFALVASAFNETECAAKIKDTHRLKWAFALQVVNFVIHLAAVGATAAAGEDEAEEAASEPTKEAEAEGEAAKTE